MRIYISHVGAEETGAVILLAESISIVEMEPLDFLSAFFSFLQPSLEVSASKT